MVRDLVNHILGRLQLLPLLTYMFVKAQIIFHHPSLDKKFVNLGFRKLTLMYSNYYLNYN